MRRLGLGCVQLGSVRAGMDHRTSIRLVHHAIDRGITWFDTADVYSSGTSEYLLGRALRGRRDSVTITTKVGYLFGDPGPIGRRVRLTAATLMRGRRRDDVGTVSTAPTRTAGSYDRQTFTPGYLTAALDASLRRLATDHVDVYLLHGFDAGGESPTEIDALAQWCLDATQAGKIGRFGVAAETPAQAERANQLPAFTAALVPFGLLDVDCGASVIPAAHAAGRTVIARGVLGAGLLAGGRGARNHPKAPLVAEIRRIADQAGITVPQLALWFAARRDDVDVVLAGASSRRHVDELVDWFAAEPPDPDVFAQVGAVVGGAPSGTDVA